MIATKFPLRIKEFQTILLRWFDLHGRKNLPWQKDKTPYKVWISEVMLQQTQVNTVIPYFERFIKHFPNVETLAKAEEDSVFQLWAGLGYYHRAKHLHSTAKKIFYEFKNYFPDDIDTLMSLPGIGKTTASAILSLAFEKPAAILDGNVKRVMSRLHALHEPSNKTLWEVAERYAAKNAPAEYTQAIMDLGATQCVRKNPFCATCPFEPHCLARRQNLENILPSLKIRKKLPERQASFLVIQNSKKEFYIAKRALKGIWPGLFCFPEFPEILNEQAIKKICREQFFAKTLTIEFKPSFKHTFTHFHLHIHPILVTIGKPKKLASFLGFWYNLKKIATLPLPQPIKRIVQTLEISS